MTLINLIKFITEHSTEMHKSEDGVSIFIENFLLEEFVAIFKGSAYLFDDAGIPCTLKDGYLAFELSSFLTDLEPDEIQEALKGLFTD